jgi:transketolase
VAAVVNGRVPVELLGIRDMPRSGKPGELMKAHGIDADAIAAAVRRRL